MTNSEFYAFVERLEKARNKVAYSLDPKDIKKKETLELCLAAIYHLLMLVRSEYTRGFQDAVKNMRDDIRNSNEPVLWKWKN